MAPEEIFRRLRVKTWEELEPVDKDGRLYFPEVIKRKCKDGTFEEVPVLLSCLRQEDKCRARVAAVQWAKEAKIDRDADADLFAELENVCRVAYALSDHDKPGSMFQVPQALQKHFDCESLRALLFKMPYYEALIDPCVSIQTEDELWAAAAAVASTGSISPLVEFDGPGQNAFMIFTARQAVTSPTGQSWLQSFERSTQEPSGSAN